MVARARQEEETEPRATEEAGSALREFLGERHVPCPGCGYDLRGLRSGTCPECGAGLRLSLLAEPVAARTDLWRAAAWHPLVLVAVLSAGTGLLAGPRGAAVPLLLYGVLGGAASLVRWSRASLGEEGISAEERRMRHSTAYLACGTVGIVGAVALVSFLARLLG
jgi:hypothetical protein